MKRKTFARAAALLLSAALVWLAMPWTGFAESEPDAATGEDILVEFAELQVPEAVEAPLIPEAELPQTPEGPAESAAAPEEGRQADAFGAVQEDAVLEAPPEVMAPEAADSAPDTDFEALPEDVPGWKTRAFRQTEAVDTATWDTLNLARAGGFAGKLARVTGTLTLKNALIDGQVPDAAALTDHFELGPYSCIVLDSGAKLALSVNALSFNRGDKRTLALRWKGKKVSGKKAKWASSDKKVVKVSAAGKITAVGPGTAVVTAKYKKNKAFCRVVVTNINYVKKIKLNKSKMTVPLNCAVQLKATISPADAVEPGVNWSSSNSAVASVDKDGLVSGLKSGKAVITARSFNGRTAKCKVTVKEIKPKSLGFSRAFITLNPGQSAATGVNMSPAVVSNPRVVYSSSNASVAAIDADGVITAKAVGRTTITVRAAARTSVAATCTVFVVAPGSGRLAGLVIGINPGHQKKTIYKKYPIAPGSKQKAYGCKVGAGGRWSHIPEYEVVLQIGLKLQKKLTDAGATVIMTRTSNNVSLTNIQRARMLNNANVDVALQLHCNSNKKKSHHGCSGFVRSTGKWYKRSKGIAKALTKAISANTGMTNKGVKVYNRYMSLNWTTTPSVLLEMGYLSNKTEDLLLATDEFREKIAQGIFDGLCAYYGR